MPNRQEILREIMLHFLALGYNVETCILYFRSIDIFPAHMELTPSPLTALPSNLKYIPLVPIVGLDLVLLKANQEVFPKRLKHLFNIKTRPPHDISPQKERRRKMQGRLSALFKGTITSTSLLALLNQFIGPKWATAVVIIVAPGNFAAQFSMFLENMVKQSEWLKSKAGQKWLAHYLSFSYAIANAALYFNAADISPKDANWLSTRIINADKLTTHILLPVNAILSAQFLYATYQSFDERLFNMLSAAISDRSEAPDLTFKERLTPRACPAAFWKTAVTSVSLIALFSQYGMPEVGIALAVAFLGGNYLSQLTLYAPVKKSPETIPLLSVSVNDPEPESTETAPPRRWCSIL